MYGVLYKIMKWVALQKGFAYHTKCKSLGLNHLYFADDMLVFSKGDIEHFMLLLRGLRSFSLASGLTNNASKSNIFSANMNQQGIEDICDVSGYEK